MRPSPGPSWTPSYSPAYEEFARGFFEGSGVTVTVDRPLQYPVLLEKLATGEVQVARLQGLDYLVAREKGLVDMGLVIASDYLPGLLQRIEFFASPERGFEAAQTLESMMSQFADKTPCFMLSWADAGYIVPAGMLALENIPTRPPLFVDTEPDLYRAIYEGLCDFGATYYTPEIKPSDYGVFQDLPDIDRNVVGMYVSEGVIPPAVIGYAKNTPDPLREVLTKGFLELISTEPGKELFYKFIPWYAVQLNPPDESLYDPLRNYARAAGIDLEPLLTPPYMGTENSLNVLAPSDGSNTNRMVINTLISDQSFFFPFRGSSTLQKIVLPAIYAELVRMDAQGAYFAYLAEELPTLENGLARFVGEGEDRQLEVEFRLRPGLTWHDGEPLTGEDLVFSWNLVMDPGWTGSHRGRDGYAPEIYVDSVETTAPNSVVFRFMSQRQAREAANNGGRLKDAGIYSDRKDQVGPVAPLDYPDAGRNVFPRHLLQDLPPAKVESSDFARQPVYAGAYRLVEGGQGGRQPILLEAFEEFALGEPSIAQIQVGYVESQDGYGGWLAPEALSELMASGEIDVQFGYGINLRKGEDPSPYITLEQQGSAKVYWSPENWWEILDFNLDNPHLSDPRVRQAIAHAIDRQAIIQKALSGIGSPLISLFPAWHPLYAGEESQGPYPYDPARARRLLEEAGYDLNRFPAYHPEREGLSLNLASMDIAPYPRRKIADILRQQLATIGIEVQVQFYELAEFEAEDCSGVRNGRRFGLGMAGWLGVGPRPVGWVENMLASWSIPTAENGCPIEKSNWPGWKNPRVDAIVHELQDGRLALEKPEEYHELWVELQALYTNELPTLPLFDFLRPLVASNRAQGIEPSPFGFSWIEDTWNIFEWDLRD